jgi:formylglycine-generating enzyme required for sulfatase activity
VPEAVPAKRLLVVPSPEQLLVSGQVFRDCENCPDVVVVVPPARAISASDVQVMPRKEVTDLKPFALGRFEITFDDWAFCVTSGGCKEMPEDAGWGRNTRPVINVSHKMIEEQYLPWLASVTGKAYRLPTSAEWQYAESGADVGAPMLLDPLTLCQTGNFSATNAGQSGVVACNDGYSTTSPVGVHRPNTIGLHDMRGNVWEWVSDCWTPGFTYKAKPSELECRKRQVRGGSWSSRAELSPEAAKGFEDATRISKTIGFRIARDLP